MVKVDASVIQLLRHTGEHFVAERAFVKRISGVQFPVRDQSQLRGKALPTVHAQEAGHACVRAHVRLQRHGSLEDFTALGAFERPLLVHAAVTGQPAGRGEGPRAEVALLGRGPDGAVLLLLDAEPYLRRLVGRFLLHPGILEDADDPRPLALLLLRQEVLPLVLEEVLGRGEDERALRALVRVAEEEHLGRLLVLDVWG